MLGKIGEKNVSIMLKFLPKDYHVFNDIYLEVNGITTQIDHLIISNCGIFVIEKLRASIILDENVEDKHIQNIKARLKQKKEMINHGICPKCKTKLVEKNGRYGKFIGCNNYPKWKFILKKQEVV